jgi:hypothetical protein
LIGLRPQETGTTQDASFRPEIFANHAGHWLLTSRLIANARFERHQPWKRELPPDGWIERVETA